MSIQKFAGALLLLVLGTASANAQGIFRGFGLVGTWKTSIDIPNRPGGALAGIMQVHIDGTMLYSDITQIVPQRVGPNPTDVAFTTPSYGAWDRADGGFRLTHVEVLASPNTSVFGSCTTVFDVRLTGDGGEFKGNATFTCFDATGQQAGPPGTAPISGKRIIVTTN